MSHRFKNPVKANFVFWLSIMAIPHVTRGDHDVSRVRPPIRDVIEGPARPLGPQVGLVLQRPPRRAISLGKDSLLTLPSRKALFEWVEFNVNNQVFASITPEIVQELDRLESKLLNDGTLESAREYLAIASVHLVGVLREIISIRHSEFPEAFEGKMAQLGRDHDVLLNRLVEIDQSITSLQSPNLLDFKRRIIQNKVVTLMAELENEMEFLGVKYAIKEFVRRR